MPRSAQIEEPKEGVSGGGGVLIGGGGEGGEVNDELRASQAEATTTRGAAALQAWLKDTQRQVKLPYSTDTIPAAKHHDCTSNMPTLHIQKKRLCDKGGGG